MLWRKLAVLAILLSGGVSTAWAQSKFEITPFFGTRFHGNVEVDTPTVDYLTIRSTKDYGALFDYTIWDNFQAEFMWNQQPTELSEHSIFDDTLTPLTSTDLTMYQFSGLYAFRDPSAKLKPFVVAGLGFTHFGGTQQYIGFGNKFAYNIGGGVKYYLNSLLGLRFDMRYSPSRTTISQQTECDIYGDCYLANVSNHATQFQANIGLIVRFNKPF